MSIPLTIYDVFGNMIPGLLYLYVLNEALVTFRLPSIDMVRLNEVWVLVAVGVAAYILGYLFNVITHFVWETSSRKRKKSETTDSQGINVRNRHVDHTDNLRSFANLIPGLLYLYVINETLIAFNLRAIDLSQLDRLSNLVLVGLAAFVCGHLANSFIYPFWYRLFVQKYMDREALTRMGARNPDIKFNFKMRDSHLLSSIIRHHTPDLAGRLH